MPAIITRDTRIDWAALLAGAVVATAIGLILASSGPGLGLAVNAPHEGEGRRPSPSGAAATSAPAFVRLSPNSRNMMWTSATACMASSSGASAVLPLA